MRAMPTIFKRVKRESSKNQELNNTGKNIQIKNKET
jgi:hypothetical protein